MYDNKNVTRIPMDMLDEVDGGYIVKDNEANKYYLVRQDGTVIGPAPDEEKASELARGFNISTDIMTREDYEKKFGREFNW